MHGVDTDIENQANGTLTRPRAGSSRSLVRISPLCTLWCDKRGGGRQPTGKRFSAPCSSHSVERTRVLGLVYAYMKPRLGPSWYMNMYLCM